jgi:hypothetical protein
MCVRNCSPLSLFQRGEERPDLRPQQTERPGSLRSSVALRSSLTCI